MNYPTTRVMMSVAIGGVLGAGLLGLTTASTGDAVRDKTVLTAAFPVAMHVSGSGGVLATLGGEQP